MALSASALSLSSKILPRNHNIMQKHIVVPLILSCKEEEKASLYPSFSKRSLALSLSSAFLLPALLGNAGGSYAQAAVLEAEDDLELLEKVKKDRKKRLEKQGIINSSNKETGYLQDVVYKLSEVGQAIENNDLNAASSVLGKNTETDWIKKANTAFSKLSSSPEEKAEVEVFNTSISNLISSVDNRDVEPSKLAFVSSASAFEKWTTLIGLDDQLKGL